MHIYTTQRRKATAGQQQLNSEASGRTGETRELTRGKPRSKLVTRVWWIVEVAA